MAAILLDSLTTVTAIIAASTARADFLEIRAVAKLEPAERERLQCAMGAVLATPLFSKRAGAITAAAIVASIISANVETAIVTAAQRREDSGAPPVPLELAAAIILAAMIAAPFLAVAIAGIFASVQKGNRNAS